MGTKQMGLAEVNIFSYFYPKCTYSLVMNSGAWILFPIHLTNCCNTNFSRMSLCDSSFRIGHLQRSYFVRPFLSLLVTWTTQEV